MKSFRDLWQNTHPLRKEIKATFVRTVERKATEEETRRVLKILDSDYKKADLEEVVNSADNLNQEQQNQLLKLLKDFEELFDGTLGRWKTTPVVPKITNNLVTKPKLLN